MYEKKVLDISCSLTKSLTIIRIYNTCNLAPHKGHTHTIGTMALLGGVHISSFFFRRFV